MKFISGGITAPKGFKANGLHCGLRKNKSKNDLALIYSEVTCVAAAMYTQNIIKGAPVIVTKRNLENGKAQAIIANSGNANCTADGIETAEKMCEIAANLLNISKDDVIVASTGVIGKTLPIEPIKSFSENLVKGLSTTGSTLAASAIMTMDTVVKEEAILFEINGKDVYIGSIAKGTGMLHPNMATMLGFASTDCNISKEMLDKAMYIAVEKTFNMISVDGDTSTNDTYAIMANGLAENEKITEENEEFFCFVDALTAVCKSLAMKMAKDGEGATKLLISKVNGAKDYECAKAIAKSIICSNLVKSAMFACDANWGRILCAIGYAGVDLSIEKVEILFESKNGVIKVCEQGVGIEFAEDIASKILSADEIQIIVNLYDGNGYAEAYGCDLTYDYIRINGDYRKAIGDINKK